MKHVKLTDREMKALFAIMRCGEAAYGPAIREVLVGQGGENVRFGALYATLDNLESKGLVETFMGAPTPERGGKRKKFFRVNGVGQIALAHAARQFDRLREGVNLPVTVGEGAVA